MSFLRGALFIVILLCSFTYARGNDKAYLDSLFARYSGYYSGAAEKAAVNSDINPKLGKCGTILALQIKDNFFSFTEDQQAVIKKINSRPDCDTSIVSPLGYFRIHFYSKGSLTPKYSVDELAKALDSSYNFEVNYLRYPPPPGDDTSGGDNLYDVYLTSTGNYGITFPETALYPGSDLCRSYIAIENSFAGMPIAAIDAARVTAAHEFQHAIQFGNYGSNEALHFFMEVTATSMEEFVFDSINDYFTYLKSYFSNSWHRFNRFKKGEDGYQLAIWNIFQKEKYGYDIIKREWELARQCPTVEAIDKALKEYNTSFAEAYNEFGLWCWFTNYRAVKGKFFPDAGYYPLLNPLTQLEFNGSSLSVNLEVFPASNNPVMIINRGALDTLTIMITNGDVAAAAKELDTIYYKSSFAIAGHLFEGAKKISSRYYSNLSANSSVWIQGEILNNKINEGNIAELPLVYNPFPVPFSYKSNSLLYFPITNSDAGVAELNIYTSSMSRVYNGTPAIVKYFDKKVVCWNALDNSGSKLSSGVYIYTIKTANNLLKGKCVLISD